MPNEQMGSRAMPQPPDVATRIVVAAAAGFLAFVAIAMVILFFYLKANAPEAFQESVEKRFPEPALQKNPRDDLRRFELEQRAALSEYHWVDRSNGLARIPIDEAMRIVAARGNRAYDAPDQSTAMSNAGNPGGAR